MFETSRPINGYREFVARIEPPATFWDLEGLDVRKEFPVVQLAFRGGLPVAEPLWLEDDASKLGLRFFVSRRMPGTIYGTVKEMTTDIPEEIIAKLAEVLARMHNMPLDRDNSLIKASHLGKWLDHPSLAANTRAGAQEWGEQLISNHVEPSPLVRQALDWLIAFPPPNEGTCSLIHGDFGLQNILIEDGELKAILDWETARVGDAAEEFGHFFSGLGGRIDQDEFMRLYRAAGGREISEYQLRYFDVYDAVQRALACLVVLARLDNLDEPNVAWAVFGLQYVRHYASRIGPLIEAAEAARGK
jgi:aminoglycoside phosphotransferase (APT) family kinase protein